MPMNIPAHTRCAVDMRVDHPALDTAGIRRARVYAKLVVGGQEAGDRLLAEAIEHYTLYANRGRSGEGCFASLFQSMRMLLRLPESSFASVEGRYGKPMPAHASLPLEVREAAALCIAGEMEVADIAGLMARTAAEIDAMLDQTWGSFIVLLSYCRNGQ